MVLSIGVKKSLRVGKGGLKGFPKIIILVSTAHSTDLCFLHTKNAVIALNPFCCYQNSCIILP